MRSSRYAKRVLTSAIVLATLVAPAVTAQPASATSLSFVQHRPTLGFDPFVVQTGDVDGDGTVDPRPDRRRRGRHQRGARQRRRHVPVAVH
jgi:hypothetical protein